MSNFYLRGFLFLFFLCTYEKRGRGGKIFRFYHVIVSFLPMYIIRYDMDVVSRAIDSIHLDIYSVHVIYLPRWVEVQQVSVT